jgi:hypothetical protein
MKLVKSLLLGSVAGIAAITGAQAADLPLAEPVEYVRVCDTWGKGFFYIPGSQTCLQVSGYMRSDVRYTEQFARAGDIVTFRNRAQIQFDARTQTEMGTLRSYIRLRSDFTNEGSNNFFAHQAFVQFAGFTAGRATSFYDAVYDGSYIGGINSDTGGVNLVGYTATFGTGFSASLAIEDRSNREQTFAAGGGLAPIVYAGTTMPDVVANLRVAQGWGSVQLSGAVHQNRDNTVAGGVFVGDDDSEYGWTAQLAGAVNLPFGGKGTRLWASAAYADGAVHYLGSAAAPWVGSANLPYADSYLVGGSLDTTTGYALTGGGTFFFSPALRTNLTVGYADVDAPVLIGDFSQVTAAANVIYSPVADLDLGLEVFYQGITEDNLPAGFPASSNDDRFGAIARIERRF